MPKRHASALALWVQMGAAPHRTVKRVPIGIVERKRGRLVADSGLGCEKAASHAGTNKHNTRLMLLHPEEDRARLLAPRLPKTGIGSLAPWGRLVGAGGATPQGSEIQAPVHHHSPRNPRLPSSACADIATKHRLCLQNSPPTSRIPPSHRCPLPPLTSLPAHGHNGERRI